MEKPTFNRIAFIDSLRGIAAFAVLIFHLVQQHGAPLPLWARTIGLQGNKGVQLFYVVSALTLFWTMQIRSERGESSPYSFFLRRFFRIAPLFYFAVLYYLWLYGFGPRYAMGSTKHITPLHILMTLIFLNGFHPYWINSIVPVGWSVAVEMFFYCFVPFLFRYIRSISSALLLCVGSLIFSYLLLQLLFPMHLIPETALWREFLYQWFPNQLPVFCIGIVVYFTIAPYLASNGTIPTFASWAMRIGIGSIATISGFFFLPTYIIYSFIFALIIIFLARYRIPFLENRFFLFMGKISYSMYLCHVACVRVSRILVEHFLGSPNGTIEAFFLFSALSIAMTLVISACTYQWIEVPGQKLGSIINKSHIYKRLTI